MPRLTNSNQAADPVDSPLKWHGGKKYLADKIVSLMPPRCRRPNNSQSEDYGWVHYVEPYFGGGNVLFALKVI